MNFSLPIGRRRRANTSQSQSERSASTSKVGTGAPKEFRQGDYLPNLHNIPTYSSKGKAALRDTPLGVVIVTQCCDLARGAESVHVSPVVQLDADTAVSARSGKSSRFGDLSGDLHADFGVVATIPMALALEWSEGFVRLSTSEARKRFAGEFSRRFSRFAYPDAFQGYVEPLKAYVRKRSKGEASDIAKTLDRVVTLRLEVKPNWEATTGIELVLLVVIDPQYLPSSLGPAVLPKPIRDPAKICHEILESDPYSPAMASLWAEFGESIAEKLKKPLSSSNYVESVDVEVLSTAELTLDRYLASSDLDLDDISDRRA